MSSYSSLDAKKLYDHPNASDINANGVNRIASKSELNYCSNNSSISSKYNSKMNGPAANLTGKSINISSNTNSLNAEMLNNNSTKNGSGNMSDNLIYFSNLLKSCKLSVSHSAILNDLCQESAVACMNTSSLEKRKHLKNAYDYDCSENGRAANYSTNSNKKTYYKTLSINRLEINNNNGASNSNSRFGNNNNNSSKLLFNNFNPSALSHRSNLSLPINQVNTTCNSSSSDLNSDPKRSKMVHSNLNYSSSFNPTSNNKENNSSSINNNVLNYRTSFKKLNTLVSKSSSYNANMNAQKPNRPIQNAIVTNFTKNRRLKEFKELNIYKPKASTSTKRTQSINVSKNKRYAEENVSNLPPIVSDKYTNNFFKKVEKFNTTSPAINMYMNSQQCCDGVEDDNKTVITSITATTATTLINNAHDFIRSHKKNNELIINLDFKTLSFQNNDLIQNNGGMVFGLANFNNAKKDELDSNSNINLGLGVVERSDNFDVDLETLDPDEYFYFNGYFSIK
jgi:hypothetical protein